jgi:OOP family OmpA-OmpF porin
MTTSNLTFDKKNNILNLMRLLRALLYCLGLTMLTACSASYKNLSNNSHTPPTKFTKHLMDSYTAKADFEAKEMHDWNSAKLYSEKALSAARGKKIKPEELIYWKISKDKVKELQIAYENLMIVYDNAIEKDPYNLAVAISSLDCWAEQQEENWQTWDIERCKDDFLKAMHQIYNKIEETNGEKKIDAEEKEEAIKSDANSKNISNSDSVSVVTKKEKEILQIIYFDFDKYNLTDVSSDSIKKFIEEYKNKIDTFLVVGHTDTKGTKEYNLELSLKRAEAVKKILIHLGISSEKIKILGKGEGTLLIQTKDETKHPANRRAEISPSD